MKIGVAVYYRSAKDLSNDMNISRSEVTRSIRFGIERHKCYIFYYDKILRESIRAKISEEKAFIKSRSLDKYLQAFDFINSQSVETNIVEQSTRLMH